MSNDTITRVREAEEKADAIVQAARAEADGIINGARRSAEDKKASAALLASKVAKDGSIKSAKDGADIIEAKTEEAKNEVKETILAAESRIDSAVGIIIREIFEKWQ